MSEYLPFEIQIEIIKRLPTKSAIKFRLVSKPWDSYIGSSEFVNAHHRRNIHNQPHCLLAWYKNPSDVDTYVTVLDDDTLYQQEFTPKSSPFTNLLKDLKVVDCSLGLVCVYGSYYKHPSTKVAILWNPLIKKCLPVVLPPSAFVSASATRIVGFGVCPVDFDPIVVSISIMDKLPWKVEVFTLTSGTWKTLVSSNLPRKTIYLQSSGQCAQVVIDRFIYFNAREGRIVVKDEEPQTRTISLIVSFDLTTHKFDVIELPDILSYNSSICLSKLRESIVVVEFINKDHEVNVVWVMEDIVTKSFAKRYAIEAPNSLTKTILGFRKNEEPVMEAEDHGEGTSMAILEVYEPSSEHISKLGINGKPFSFFVSSYVETLLLLDQADCLMHAESD